MTFTGAIPQGGLLAGQQSLAITQSSGGGISGSQYASAGAAAAEGIFGLYQSLNQARALKRSARQVEMAGIADANDRAREGRRAIGYGMAVAGASGFTVDGSATDVLAELSALSETSAARARWSADREAERLRFEARQTKRAGIFGAILGVAKAGLTLGAGGG